MEITCTVYKHKKYKDSETKSKIYKGKVDPIFFRSGYTNCCEALLNGQPSLLGLTVEGNDNQFTVTLGDGTKRYYTYFRYEFPHDQLYRLIREDFPNGNHRYYSYTNAYTTRPKRIWSTNRDETLTLNWINFSYEKNDFKAEASNGQTVIYQINHKKGNAKNGFHSLVWICRHFF